MGELWGGSWQRGECRTWFLWNIFLQVSTSTSSGGWSMAPSTTRSSTSCRTRRSPGCGCRGRRSWTGASCCVPWSDTWSLISGLLLPGLTWSPVLTSLPQVHQEHERHAAVNLSDQVGFAKTIVPKLVCFEKAFPQLPRLLTGRTKLQDEPFDPRSLWNAHRSVEVENQTESPFCGVCPAQARLWPQGGGEDRELSSAREVDAGGQAEPGDHPVARPPGRQEGLGAGVHPEHDHVRPAHLPQQRVRLEEHRSHSGPNVGRSQETSSACSTWVSFNPGSLSRTHQGFSHRQLWFVEIHVTSKAVPLIRAIELLESHFEKGSGVLTAVQVTKTFWIPIDELMKWYSHWTWKWWYCQLQIVIKLNFLVTLTNTWIIWRHVWRDASWRRSLMRGWLSMHFRWFWFSDVFFVYNSS